ncbi:MAG: OadG family protein [Oscillospiraceae bacterium]|jgi:Na+-transporting methylmalonyl-CoA/oxaloacetate decarboxylase gamma subunit|nr:OadG family protein [Oscillospiraceae bacterium]
MPSLSVWAAAADKWLVPMSLPDGLLLALVGIGTVFVALVSILILVKIQSAAVAALTRKPAAPAVKPVSPAHAQASAGVPAPGSLGDVALHDVPDQTAALLMAIVADQLQAPLNQLRFISIKEVSR